MLRKAIIVVSLVFVVNIVGHSQTIDVIITKSGENIFGEILENESDKIEIKENGSNVIQKVLKSEIREVLLGFKYEDMSEAMINEIESGIPDYDYIVRTNGDRLNVVIVGVSDDKVAYRYPFESDDDVREIDRRLVAEIYQKSGEKIDPIIDEAPEIEEEEVEEEKLDELIEAEKYVEEVNEEAGYENKSYSNDDNLTNYQMEMDLEEKYMEEVIYTQNRMNMATFNFTAMGLGALAFGYERALGKNKGLEAVVSIHGMGLENQNVEKEGFGFEIGYKYKMGNIFSEYYLPDHLMSGTYIKPIVGFVTVNERIENYSGNNSFVFQNKNRDYGYAGLDLGYQWVFGDLVSMDIYSGVAYYNGDFEITTNDNGEIRVTEDNYFDEGDFFASDNFGAKAGFRIGILFGSKSNYKSK